MSAVIFRYTEDLRVESHRGLALAGEYGPVLPAYVMDRSSESAFSHTPRKAGLVAKALHALAESLEHQGSRLIFRRGPVGVSLRRLARAVDAHTVVWSARYDAPSLHADARLQAELEEAGIRVCIVHDRPALSPENLPGPAGMGYRSFAAYLPVWRAQVMDLDVGVTPKWLVCDLHSEPLPQVDGLGGSDIPLPDVANAGAMLEQFLAGLALSYGSLAKTPAAHVTSRLGPMLSVGSLGAAHVVSRTQDCMREPLLLTEERASLAEFLRSLARRDFFYQLAWFNPETHDQVLQEKMRTFAFAQDHERLDAWRTGTTGFALVDAGMRQLRATGWMHPYVARIVASFLCFDLGVDWRIGRAEFARHALDDETALATGNWQWAAGVGADLAQFPRIFHPERQRLRYDPDGRYVRQWIPELAHDALMPMQSDQLDLPLFGERQYPAPIHSHEQAARAFLGRYRAHLIAHAS